MIKTLVIVTSSVLLVACGSGDEQRPGEESVYQRIDSMTGCADLQTEFDAAMGNVDRLEPGTAQRDIALSYAEAAESRMQEIDC